MGRFKALLAALFLVAGSVKLVLPLDQLRGPIALPGAPSNSLVPLSCWARSDLCCRGSLGFSRC